MPEIRCTPAQLAGLLRKHEKERIRRIRRNLQRTAKDAVPIIKENAPKAFFFLEDSVHDEDMKTVVDAPHAAAVEVGSRPHTPPLDPLVAWVVLKITQMGSGEEARRIARAIQIKISKVGTRPHWFVRSSLPAIRLALDGQMYRAVFSVAT